MASRSHLRCLAPDQQKEYIVRNRAACDFLANVRSHVSDRLWGFPLSPLPMDFLNIHFLEGGRSRWPINSTTTKKDRHLRGQGTLHATPLTFFPQVHPALVLPWRVRPLSLTDSSATSSATDECFLRFYILKKI